MNGSIVAATAVAAGLVLSGGTTPGANGPPSLSGADSMSVEVGEAPADDMQAHTGAIFNDPNGDVGEQYRIRDYIQGLVERAPEGSTITMSIYNITEFDFDFAAEVLRASFRGVSTRLILEGDAAGETASGRVLLAGLGSDTNADSWAVECDSGCHASNINHNKFFLFSEVDGQEDVVVQSSANLTVQNGSRLWNNAISFVDNRELYDGYMGYFYDLARRESDPDYHRTYSADGVDVFHFPRLGNSRDTDDLVDALDLVVCGNAGGDGETVVRVAQDYIGRPEVAGALAGKAEQGCDIRVAYTSFNFGSDDELFDVENVTLRHLEDRSERNKIHSKYLLVEGGYAGQSDQSVVFTGSPNISYNALRNNDETMVRTFDPEIHEQYVENFEMIWADGEEAVQAPTLDIDLAVSERCVASNVVLVPSVRNNSDITVSATFETEYGTTSVDSVDPGARRSVSINSGSQNIDAGSIILSASGTSHGSEISGARQLGFEGRSC